ncbi:uncharacterized protein LOC132314981 [Cornus florida]|uniref:uncharacterized protein LOC132314981 n=1 Tax=Cornus florida TaxID=4283 RepID=UPI002896C797|nr:uncharacterized protein LOC132314981 [Cornus florida]
MEAERSRAVKRKPLSDRTNLNPTTFRDHSSSLFVKPPKSNPITKSKPKNKPNPKPYNPSTNGPDNSSSKSFTSGGSSNNDRNNTANPRTIRKPHSSVPVCSERETAKKTKNKGKAIAVSSNCHLERSKDKGKAVAVPFGCTTLERTNDKKKEVAVTCACPPLEKTEDIGKAIAMHSSCSPLEKSKDKGKAVAMSFVCLNIENMGNEGKSIDARFSCPPLQTTRNIREELNKSDDIGLYKSFTVPRPKHKKKRYCLLPEQDISEHAAPQDFIEQQRAYFKEIDEFELPEEEVSCDELDK